MRKMLLCMGALLIAACGSGGSGGGSFSDAKPQSEDEKTLYALGLNLGRNLQVFSLTDQELALVQRGLHDQIKGTQPLVALEEYGPKISELARNRSMKRADEEQKRGEEYQAKAAAEQGAQKTPSGLIYKELTPGTGAQPTITDTVKVHYKGTLTNGTEFDSSYKRGQPIEFPLSGVIPCWGEGVAKMKVGGKAQLVCPPSIAYGQQGRPGIPGGATLIFEVELLDIVKAQGAEGGMPAGHPEVQPIGGADAGAAKK